MGHLTRREVVRRLPWRAWAQGRLGRWWRLRIQFMKFLKNDAFASKEAEKLVAGGLEASFPQFAAE